MPKPYDQLDEQFELFLQSIPKSIDLCSSVKQDKTKNVNHLGSISKKFYQGQKQ